MVSRSSSIGGQPTPLALRSICGVDDLALALELTDACDAITLGRYRAADLAVETKADATPVSEADRGAEEAVRERLARERPQDAVVGEEYGASETAGARRWIVDPIDGTKNYVRGIPVWATLLALQEAGEPAVAVVSAPALGRRWWAARGAGAFVRDPQGERRLSVSAVAELAGAQLSFAGIEEWRQAGRLEDVLALAERVRPCARSRRLLGLHAGGRGCDRDRARPGGVALGPGGPAADRRGGGRAVHRSERAAHAGRRRRARHQRAAARRGPGPRRAPRYVSPLHALAIFAAGIAAGTINTVVGSGTLITFPVLLAFNYAPVVANVSNTIGLVPGSAAGAWGYRHELAGQRRRAVPLLLASTLGGIVGSILLLTLPASAFKAIVPAFIVIALVLIVLQPRLSKAIRVRRRSGSERAGPAATAGVFASGVYGGYFGAAQGILLLAILGLAVDDDLQRINALKVVLAGLVNLVAGIVFVFAAHIAWLPALLIAVGSILGGVLGARYGRRLPPAALRAIIVVVGIVAIVRLV